MISFKSTTSSSTSFIESEFSCPRRRAFDGMVRQIGEAASIRQDSASKENVRKPSGKTAGKAEAWDNYFLAKKLFFVESWHENRPKMRSLWAFASHFWRESRTNFVEIRLSPPPRWSPPHGRRKLTMCQSSSIAERHSNGSRQDFRVERLPIETPAEFRDRRTRKLAQSRGDENSGGGENPSRTPLVVVAVVL